MRAVRVLAAVLLVASTSGCGFLGDLADPDHDRRPAVAGESVAGPAVPTPLPDAPRVLVRGELLNSSDVPVGRLTVTAGPVRTGLVPPVPNFPRSCPVAGPSLQYVPVDVALTGPEGTGIDPRLAAHLSVSTGPSTPPDIGDVGVFVESHDGGQRYCEAYPPLPTTDTFWNQMGAEKVTGYVVLDRAVTPSTPGGRPDVFPTLQIRLDTFRDKSETEEPLTVGEILVGGECADDSDAICVPLG